MDAPHATTAATPCTTGSWRELAARTSDGLEITLLWNRATHEVRVNVSDRRRTEAFEFEAAPDEALDAYHHPFVYVSGRGHRAADALGESIALQVQS